MNKPALPLIVVTDLDGTLLDHHSYSFRPAMPALACLRSLGIPCILNSSKTFDEMLELREKLNNTSPFVCENGGAVFIPSCLFQPISQVVMSVLQFGLQFQSGFPPKKRCGQFRLRDSTVLLSVANPSLVQPDLVKASESIDGSQSYSR